MCTVTQAGKIVWQALKWMNSSLVLSHCLTINSCLVIIADLQQFTGVEEQLVLFFCFSFSFVLLMVRVTICTKLP